MNKKLIIGDIHGEYQTLSRLLEAVEAKVNLAEVQVVFQELSDRGLDTRRTFDFVIKYKKKYPQTKVLLSNHDEELIGPSPLGDWEGTSGLLDYPNLRLLASHARLIHSMEAWIEFNHFFVVHGGIPAGVSHPREAKTSQLLWNCGAAGFKTEKKVVMGHQVFDYITYDDNQIFIDTGACFKEYGILSAVLLDDQSGEVLEEFNVNTDFSYRKDYRLEKEKIRERLQREDLKKRMSHAYYLDISDQDSDEVE